MKQIISPKTAFIAITLKCNSHCVMCDIWKTKKSKEIKAKIYQKLPSSLKNVDITGGEPFLRKDLPEILSNIKIACPKTKILITSNGLLPEIIKKVTPKLLKIDKNIAFRISLDGLGKIHDQIRGINGSYAKVNKTIKILKYLDVKNLGVIFTLTEINKKHLSKVLSFCTKEKLNFSLNLVQNSPIYFGSKHTHLRPSSREIKKYLNIVSKYYLRKPNIENLGKYWFYKNTIKYLNTNIRPLRCGAGENFFYMDPEGNIFLCHLKNWLVGNLEKQTFTKIWQGKKRKQLLNYSEKCNDCWMVCTAKDEIKTNKFKIFRKMVEEKLGY